ncbi:cobalamin biosynthesis protein CbiM [Pleomorphomonas diazotrophica]|uniref:Cobalamin biosynthesis protein CbiM n=1 Tax=Pleomorphomonas diazotrophica TaxID=1166257 RepID=A0A1I4WJP3_9HYPH|nr:cobalt transporter CbiM [Pleomorphomonas diazotrophica]PKR91031.1 cobalamin biosynthesis protein CbiM [Pleomorphomonas diazotrophica]SFN14054.1 cobalt/nickel transport system permease protein [Pleomorphomonas diazotrophica]
MAHIPDGVLSLPVLAAATLAGAGGLALGVRQLGDRDIPRTALLAAVFFIASSLAVPLGPTSVHLLLGGLIGLMLGWKAFPAIFVGLLLQALLFGFGGLTVLGVDLLNMALPGVLLAMAVRPFVRAGRPAQAAALAGGAGALSVLITAGLVGLEIALSEPSFAPAIGVMALAYLPLAGIEALVTAFVTLYLLKVKPEMIGASAFIGSSP